MKKITLLLSLTIITTIFGQNEHLVLGSDIVSNSKFGNDVAIHDSVAVIGSSNHSSPGFSKDGRVSILEFNGSNWTETQFINPLVSSNNLNFGHSVAIEENTLVIGVPLDDENGTDAGAIYIYEKIGASFVFTEKLMATINDNPEDQYGFSVAINNGKIIVGAHLDEDRGNDAGAAYIVEKVTGTWQNTHKLYSHVGELGEEFFGYSVDIDGDYCVIGAPKDDDNGVDSGTGFVFHFNGITWDISSKLVSTDGGVGDSFGFSVGISNERIIVGAYGAGAISSQGKAYIFDFNGTIWDESQILTGASNVPDDWFGYDCSIDGNTIVIGELHDDEFEGNGGSAYVFRNKNGNWIRELNLSPSDAHLNQEFGYSTAIDSLHVLVGTVKSNISGTASGRVYHYNLCTYVPQQNLCMLSVNDNSDNVEAVWSDRLTTFIDSLSFYNENDILLDKIEFESVTQISLPGISPNTATSNTGMEVENICGMKSTTLTIHETMFLTSSFNASNKAVLNWSFYLGYPVDFYRVYRDELGDGNFQLIGAVLPSQTSYTDLNTPNTSTVRYKLEAFASSVNCTGSNVQSKSFSNITEPLLSINEQKFYDIFLISNLIDEQLEFNKQVNASFQIYSQDGRLIEQGKLVQSLQVNSFNSGWYIIQIGATRHRFFKR